MGVIEILNKQAREEGILIGIEMTQKEIDKIRNEADKVRSEADKVRSEADKEKYNNTKLVIKNMQNEGFTIEKIANLLSMSEEEVRTFFNQLNSELD